MESSKAEKLLAGKLVGKSKSPVKRVVKITGNVRQIIRADGTTENVLKSRLKAFVDTQLRIDFPPTKPSDAGQRFAAMHTQMLAKGLKPKGRR